MCLASMISLFGKLPNPFVPVMEPLPFCDMPKEGVKLVWCNLAWTLPIEF
jgi:hypothetical protein